MTDHQLVTFFIPSLEGGGAERVVVNLANALSLREKTIDLLLFHEGGVFGNHVSTGVRLKSLNVTSRWTRAFALVPFIRYIKQTKPDTVVVSGHSAFFIALVGLLLTEIRLVVIAHNTISKELGPSKWVAKFLYRLADQVIAVSEGVARDIRDWGKIRVPRLRTIYNPVDVSQISAESQEQPDHPWFLDPSNRVLVSVGSLSRQKNHKLLISAFHAARTKDANLRLIILGEGPQRSALEKLVLKLGLQEVVSMPGFVANPFAYMRAAHRFVLSSSYEGFGLVLVEALCSGARIISTDCPSGPVEILEGGRWGVLVPPDNIELMAQAITLDDSRFPNTAESRSRAMDFSLERALDAYQRVIYA
jgi:glycosyltransferase involved in cell wall biosynthesis